MLPLRRMVKDVHLLVGPVLSNQVVKKLLVDVIVEVLDSNLDFGRLTDVIFVDLKKPVQVKYENCIPICRQTDL